MARERVKFSKYQGAGNDFVIINDWQGQLRLDDTQIAAICDRRYGVGADGCIFIRPHSDADYEMVYHNADGHIGSMCGNGARCAYAFVLETGLGSGKMTFQAYDGLHEAEMHDDATVSVSMRPVVEVQHLDRINCVLDTGSPHYVRFVGDLKETDVVSQGRGIRYSPMYAERGINVNFVEVTGDVLKMSTYERGVENKTLACGTGATAVAIAYADKHGMKQGPVRILADGGELSVDFRRSKSGFENLVLRGPVSLVFQGTFDAATPRRPPSAS